jgi:hypothetical protein
VNRPACPPATHAGSRTGLGSALNHGGPRAPTPGPTSWANHIDWPMRFMAEQLRRGRASAEIMQLYAIEDGRRVATSCQAAARVRKCKHCHRADAGDRG